MSSTNSTRIGAYFLLLVVVASMATLALCQSRNPSPNLRNSKGTVAISIVGIPHAGIGGPDTTEPISGRVTGVDFTKYCVAVYVLAGGTWWVQPTVASPLTNIDDTGGWETDTHLGGTYAALLVKKSFQAPPTFAMPLPSVGGDILAVFRVAGAK